MRSSATIGRREQWLSGRSTNPTCSPCPILYVRPEPDPTGVKFGNGRREVGVRSTDLVHALSGYVENQGDLVDAYQIIKFCHLLTLQLTCDNKR
jgi:hypothetical protein